MPLVRIDLSKTQPKGLAQKVGDIIFQAMRDEINVPADDKFQIITYHDSDELVKPKSYMGIEYSEGIIFIQITLSLGRSVDLKKKFYQRIAEDSHNKLGIRKEDLFIQLVEVVKENWSFGNGLAQYAE
jgi:4-oxalocrotonate tautomerase